MTGVPATTSLRMLLTENSQHGLYNSKKHALGEGLTPPNGVPFVSAFPKSIRGNLALKQLASTDRLEDAKGIEYPPPIAYLNGKPSAYEFRQDKPDPAKQPPGAPPFHTSTLGCALHARPSRPSALRLAPAALAPTRANARMRSHPPRRAARAWLLHRRHWPVREGKPTSALFAANPPSTCVPTRLMHTENLHPAARTSRIDVHY